MSPPHLKSVAPKPEIASQIWPGSSAKKPTMSPIILPIKSPAALVKFFMSVQIVSQFLTISYTATARRAIAAITARIGQVIAQIPTAAPSAATPASTEAAASAS